jgi:aspartokinase
LADAGQVSKVCDLIASDAERRIVVVSAPGKRHAKDRKITDLLIACAEQRLAGGSAEDELRAVADRYADIQKALGELGSLKESLAREQEKARGAEKGAAQLQAELKRVQAESVKLREQLAREQERARAAQEEAKDLQAQMRQDLAGVLGDMAKLKEILGGRTEG